MSMNPFLSGSLLLSACLTVSACGSGASDDEGGEPQPLPATISLSLLSPTADANVFELGAVVPVQASLRYDSSAAPDGNTVNFSVTVGTLADAAATTRGGVASTTLTAGTAGSGTLSATASVGGIGASASMPLYFIPHPQAQQILVPAYFYPETGSPWEALIATAQRTRNQVQITTIFNPDDGHFSAVDAQQDAVARRFVAAGGSLVAYVYTKWGTGERPLAEVEADIDAYLDLYGHLPISGFFLDEMSTESSSLNFYRQLYAYIKSRDASLRVIGNPGAIPSDAAYADVADVLVSFEHYGADYGDYDPRDAAPWLYERANDHAAMIAHDVSGCAAMQAMLGMGRGARYNMGYVYITDDSFDVGSRRGEGNPYDSLPTYWNLLVDSLIALENGQALPGC